MNKNDLANLDPTPMSTAGVVMPVEHPVSGEALMDEDGKTPVTITLLGQDAPEYVQFQQRVANKRIQLATTKGRVKMTAVELEEEQMELLVLCTKGWTGINLDGQRRDCTPEEVRTVYTKVRWLREQVAKFINDRANFMGN